MPTHPQPQASAPASPGSPGQPSGGAPPSDPGAVAAKTTREGTLFHLLVERGWDAAVAYTADQRIHAMTSETVAASVQPVLDELRHMHGDMATKGDLVDLRREMAELETRLVKWMFGAMLAQTAVIVGIVVGVVPLLK